MGKPYISHRGLDSSSLSADSASELHILGHDGNSLGVDGAEVGVLEESNEISLSGLLEGKDSRRLESKIILELRSYLSDESLEGKLSDQKISALLESADLTESNSAGSESVNLLHTTNLLWARGLLCNLLGSELLSRSLTTSVLASGLLGASHFEIF